MNQANSPFVMDRDGYWQQVVHLGTIRDYAVGEIVYHQGELSDYIYYLITGRVRVSIGRPDGSEKILAIIEPGSPFGESAALDGLPSYVTARAQVTSNVCVLHRDVVLAQMAKDPAMTREVLRCLVRKQRLAAMQIEAMVFLRAKARVALILARLAADYGVPDPAGRGNRLGLRMTHEEMASVLGTSRVTVSRVVGDLIRQGILEKDKWELIVVDKDRLWQMATK